MRIPYNALADLVVAIHFAFVVFVILGGLLALKWRQFVWVHVPAVIWGVVIELAGWVCPLTPLENWLRERGGAARYTGGFVEHYIEPLLYPATLTKAEQIVFGLFALILNLAIYSYVSWRGLRQAKSKRAPVRFRILSRNAHRVR
jgi:hypothetical protein